MKFFIFLFLSLRWEVYAKQLNMSHDNFVVFRMFLAKILRFHPLTNITETKRFSNEGNILKNPLLFILISFPLEKVWSSWTNHPDINKLSWLTGRHFPSWARFVLSRPSFFNGCYKVCGLTLFTTGHFCRRNALETLLFFFFFCTALCLIAVLWRSHIVHNTDESAHKGS